MKRPSVHRIGASLIALAVLVFASASASHVHVADSYGDGAHIAHHEDDAPQPEGGPTEGHSCFSCSTAKSSVALASVHTAQAAPDRPLRGFVRAVAPVVGVALYRVGPERAPPAHA